MIPKNENINDIELVHYPTETYNLDLNKERILKYVDGIEAMKQYIYKVLMTDRYRHEIYDWNYGFEIEDLIGKPLILVKAKLPNRITDALITDDRILSVHSFTFPTPTADKKTTLCVNFIVETIYGTIQAEKEVNI